MLQLRTCNSQFEVRINLLNREVDNVLMIWMWFWVVYDTFHDKLKKYIKIVNCLYIEINVSQIQI